jgi:hypothetical protein
MIDPDAGENVEVNWTELEDVELKINYAYQDLFPEGQCE